MKLDLTNLSDYEKLVTIASPKTGMRKKDSLFFDFDKKKIFIHNDFMVAFITFDYEADEGEKYRNLFFDTSKLLIILKNFDKSEVMLSFEEKSRELTPKFLKGKDSFTIEHLFDEDNFEVSFSSNFIEFKIDSFFSSLVKEAYQFVDQTKDNQFNSIAVNQKGIYGVTPSRFYEYKTSLFEAKVEEDSSIIIHRDVAKFISFLKEEVICKYSEGKIMFSSPEVFEFIFAIPYTHTTIPSESDISQVLSLDNKIILNNNTFLSNLKFFDPFYSLDSKPIRIHVISETELELSTVSDFDMIKKIIPIEVGNSSLIGFKEEYNGDVIKQALSTLGESVDLYFNFDKIGMLLSDKDSLTKTIAIMKYM